MFSWRKITCLVALWAGSSICKVPTPKIFSGRPAFTFGTGDYPRNCVRVPPPSGRPGILLSTSYFFIFPSYFIIFLPYFFIFPEPLYRDFGTWENSEHFLSIEAFGLRIISSFPSPMRFLDPPPI